MLVLAIDQGTTGTTTVVYDRAGRAVQKAYREFPQIYPRPGWVEHDPMQIWQTVCDTVEEVMNGLQEPVAALGITNQRETTVVWDRETGEPVYNAIVWQCRRTTPACEQLAPHADLFKARTGLPLDPYFSGTKIRWLLDHIDAAEPGRLCFGTIDTWLIWKLTGGAVHATDFTNASRTLLLDIHQRAWDEELCDLIGVPVGMLPEVRPSLSDYGRVSRLAGIDGVPILGVAGDQQAALFGQAAFHAGEAKCTYGTGCFLLMNTGDEAVSSEHGLLTTLAAGPTGEPCYALEGAVFIAGAAIQWLRDELGLIEQAADSEPAALAVTDNNGVYLVPAFTGLGAPHWDAEARGTLVGLTRGANRNHLIRAALESIAYQCGDVLGAMTQETGTQLPELKVDGGAVANDFLMQFQADVLNVPVVRPTVTESTSLGAAYLAGLHAGVWKDAAALSELKETDRTFTPSMSGETRQALLAGWQHALRQTRTR